MIVIKDFKMPENCLKCPMQFGGWCYVSPPEVDERVAPTVDEAWEQGKPDWCPLIDVPEMNVGNSSEIPNSSPDCISRQAAINALGEEPMVWIGSDYELAQKNQWNLDKLAIETVPSAQPEIIRCRDCRYSEYDQIFHNRYCHNKGKADLVGDDFFCAAGRYQTNGSD